MREQFTFYRSYFESIQCLQKKDDRLSAYEAIASYALNGEEKDMTDSAKALFILIKPLLDSASRKSQGGKNSTSKAEDTDKISASNGEDTDNNIKNKKKNKVKNYMLESNTRTRFVPPTEEEAAAYYDEHGFTFGLEKWFARYESNGWKVGRDKMKDWKASMRYWQTLESKDAKPDGKVLTFYDVAEEMKAGDVLDF